MTVTNKDLFYCYSRTVSDHIYKYSEGEISPLTIAINPKSGRTFSLYVKSPLLQKALDDYKKQK
ncbi:hypothetical protein ACQ4XT_11435 [Halobacillus faecis]